MRFFSIGNGIGIIPEIQSVYISIIKPAAHLVWMVNPLTGPGFEGKATCYLYTGR